MNVTYPNLRLLAYSCVSLFSMIWLSNIVGRRYRRSSVYTRSNQARGGSEGTHLFISYARVDAIIVERFVRDLREARLSVWWDQDSIPPGTPDWQQAVRDAIDHSSVFVLVATRS